MSKHTHGPWAFSTSPNCWKVTGGGGHVIAGGTAWGIPVLMPEATANARLIAAAPDMLEALQLVVKWADDNGRTFKLSVASDSETAEKIRAAIAKATGEQA